MNILRAFMEQASAQGSRSTAVTVLLGLLGLLLSGILVGVKLGADDWIMMVLAGMATATFATFLFAYLFLLFKDRDALRSERFNLSKLAIEKSLTGDTLSGFTLLDADSVAPRLTTIEAGSSEGEAA